MEYVAKGTDNSFVDRTTAQSPSLPASWVICESKNQSEVCICMRVFLCEKELKKS